MSQNYLGEPLNLPPADGITRVHFSPFNDNLLLTSSWDKTVRLYDAVQRNLLATINHQAPVFDIIWQDANNVFSGTLDGQVRRLGLQGRDDVQIGQHQNAVQCLEHLRDRGLLVSGSWDQTLKLWDPRAPPVQNCVAVVSLPGRVYTMSASGQRLVVGTSGRQVLIYDIRRLESGQAEQQRESSLKYQTRSIACYPDGRGFAIGSVEGRVAMEFFDTHPDVQALKYAFKCHRRQEDGQDMVFPVHTISFHPVHGTFATGGGDGVINLWDGENKKRLFQISKYPTSVASVSFNTTGALMAVASSYCFEQGDRDHPRDEIYIRRMQDPEVRPKHKR